MTESIRAGEAPERMPPRLSNAVVGFEVVDRDGERVGKVSNVNLAHTCIVVESGRSLFGRTESHAVHALAIREIDLDTFTIVLAASKDDVGNAPELHELDEDSEDAVAQYYARLG